MLVIHPSADVMQIIVKSDLKLRRDVQAVDMLSNSLQMTFKAMSVEKTTQDDISRRGRAQDASLSLSCLIRNMQVMICLCKEVEKHVYITQPCVQFIVGTQSVVIVIFIMSGKISQLPWNELALIHRQSMEKSERIHEEMNMNLYGYAHIN